MKIRRSSGFFDFYDFITAHYFEATNKHFSGAAEFAPWFGLPTAKVAAEGQASDMCEGGKYQFIKQPYDPEPGTAGSKWIMQGLPPSKVWPTTELRTLVKAVGKDQKLSFYQEQTAYRTATTITPADEHTIKQTEWPTIENGMTIGAGQDITGVEQYQNGEATSPYEEYIYRIARTRSVMAAAAHPTETDRSPLKGKGRSFVMDRIANEHFWTSTPDGYRADGTVDNRKKPALCDAVHVIKPNATDNPKTHNVSQGLLRVVQRAMAAGVMIELYRQMQESACSAS